MPRRKDRPRLAIRVSFETTRLSPQCLIEAYERLAPARRRPLRAASDIPLAEAVRAMPDRGGKHA